MRYEITGGNTLGNLAKIKRAVSLCGGKRVNARRAYGWSNQPLVVTFWAESDESAKRVCDNAAIHLWPDQGLGEQLFAWQYGKGRTRHGATVTRRLTV